MTKTFDIHNFSQFHSTKKIHMEPPRIVYNIENIIDLWSLPTSRPNSQEVLKTACLISIELSGSHSVRKIFKHH